MLAEAAMQVCRYAGLTCLVRQSAMFLWCVQCTWGAGASGVAAGGTLPRGRSDVPLLSSSGGARRGGCRVRLHALRLGKVSGQRRRGARS